MTRTILIAGPELASPAMQLAEKARVRVVCMKPYAAPDEIAEAAATYEAEAIILRMGRITEEVIAASPRLKAIVKHGVGVDGIDVAAASRRGVPVLITGGANSQSVAEHALALMFSVARSTPWLDRRMRAGEWDKASHTGIELQGKALGLVGFGSIGRTLAALVKPLEMNLLVFDPHLPDATRLPEGVALVSLERLLAESDVVSLHCPLTPETRGMIGRRALRAMKRTAILINTARGELIDEPALVEALQDAWIHGAGLDTFAQEPPPQDSALWSLPNLVATPHVGANTAESRLRMGLQAMSQALQVLEGKAVDPRNIVNPLPTQAA